MEIFEKSPIGIIFYDKDGRFVDINHSGLEIAGICSKDVCKNINLFSNPHVKKRKTELLKKELIKFQASLNFDNIKRSNFYNPQRNGIAFIDYTISITDSGYLVQIQDITEEKNAQKKLIENEKESRQLIESLNEGIWIIDKEDYTTFVNGRMAEMLGYSVEEMLGKHLFSFMDEDGIEIAEEYLKRRKSGLIEQHDSEFVKKDGTKLHVTIGGSPLTDENNNYIGAIAAVMDITERKIAEESLLNSQQMLENVLENFPGVVFWKDYNLVYLGCNRNFSNGAGLNDPSEIVGKTDYDLPWGKTEADDYRADDRQVMNRGVPKLHIIETQLQSNGSIVWFDTNKIPLFDSKGKVIGILGASNDITQLKEIEEELRKARAHLEEQVQKRTKELKSAYISLKVNEQKFRELFNEATDMITLVQLNKDGTPGKFIEVNDIAFKRLGYSKEEFLHMTPLDIIAPECLKDVPNNAKELEKNRQARFEIVHLTKDGERIPIENNNHLFEMGGKTVILAISRDITERKKMENEMNELIKELERSNEELRRFAYITSHDLQEPLRTIASFTQLLERRYKGKFDKDADEFMDYIVDASVRMKQMIQDLLEYSRVATKGEEFEEVNSENVIKQVIDSLKIIIDENNAEITYDSLPNVFADESQIRRVFQNLISNAIKYRKPEEPPKIHIGVIKDDENKEYIFSVSDNSIGIEEQYFERIFTIFQQLHTLDKYKGTGIGLSIVKRIVERHGGHIWVESSLGKGSTFYFTIPFKH
ncbi:PAS domain S-box protein [Methanobacterium sp. ACI-7]|uniref:PAS domain S-box protein n=1 Tax=unclassified Methanobacterium TaxID=2627676 RepID=UPI0039C31165